ncbi:MAG: histone deacetylase [Pseudomonadota bacterium]
MSLPIVHHPDYQAPLRPGHRFPMSKYGYLRKALTARGLMQPGSWVAPAAATAATISLAHDAGYVSRAFSLTLSDQEMRAIGLPRTERVIRRARLASAGTVLAARLAMAEGIACNTAGGSHHAGLLGGAGFCTFNDVAVAAHALLSTGVVQRVLIFDCDVHQGDGTAEIFADEPAVITVSIHSERNYPSEKKSSDIDVGLADGVTDDDYLRVLEDTLRRALELGPFDIAFYNAGVDVHAEDRLGRLALSTDGVRARDRRVIEGLRGAGLPLACAIGGGYHDDPQHVAERHAILFEEAARRAMTSPSSRGEG